MLETKLGFRYLRFFDDVVSSFQSGICLKADKKHVETQQGYPSVGRDLNSGPREYEA
jgi:hypothetical protein